VAKWKVKIKVVITEVIEVDGPEHEEDAIAEAGEIFDPTQANDNQSYDQDYEWCKRVEPDAEEVAPEDQGD